MPDRNEACPLGQQLLSYAPSAVTVAAAPDLPLVIHGGSGVSPEDRLRVARETHICKFNIGTEWRMAFGAALRLTLAENPHAFDRIAILSATMDACCNWRTNPEASQTARLRGEGFGTKDDRDLRHQPIKTAAPAPSGLMPEFTPTFDFGNFAA